MFLNLAAITVFVLSVFPVYWMINTSFLPNSLIRRPEPLFAPTSPTVDNYRRVLVTEGQFPFLDALRNSLLITLLTVVAGLLLALLAALALSRFRFRSRRGLIVTVLVVQMIPAEAMILSWYQLLDGWALTNTIVGLTMVYVSTVLPFTIWTLRGFVAGLPVELEEAAMVDGCTRVGAFFRITFPLLAPGLVATGVFGFIQAWNEFTLALVVMTNAQQRTLPVWLSTFTDVNRGTDWGAVMAGSTLIAIPVIIFFLLVQSRMVAGMTAGAVKG